MFSCHSWQPPAPFTNTLIWINFNSSMGEHMLMSIPKLQAAIEIWEWMNDFIPHFIMDVISL